MKTVIAPSWDGICNFNAIHMNKDSKIYGHFRLFIFSTIKPLLIFLEKKPSWVKYRLMLMLLFIWLKWTEIVWMSCWMYYEHFTIFHFFVTFLVLLVVLLFYAWSRKNKYFLLSRFNVLKHAQCKTHSTRDLMCLKGKTKGKPLEAAYIGHEWIS